MKSRIDDSERVQREKTKLWGEVTVAERSQLVELVCDLKKVTRLILSLVCWSLWIQMWSSDSRWAVGAEKRIRFLSESSTLSSWYLDQSSFVSSCRMKRSSRAGSEPSDFCSDVTCSQISTQPVWSLYRWQKQKRWRSYKNNKPRLKLTKYKRNRKKGSINK